MLNIRPVVHLLGLLACFLAALLCIPAFTDAVYHDQDWKPFVTAALVTGFIGFGAAIATWPKDGIRLNLRQAFLITALGWVAVSGIAAIPFLVLIAVIFMRPPRLSENTEEEASVNKTMTPSPAQSSHR